MGESGWKRERRPKSTEPRMDQRESTDGAEQQAPEGGQTSAMPPRAVKRQLWTWLLLLCVLGVLVPWVLILGQMAAILVVLVLGVAFAMAVSAVISVRKNDAPAGKSLVTLVVMAFALGIAVFLTLKMPNPCEEARRTQCRSNLRQLGIAMTIYANTNGGWGPSIDPKAREIANAVGVAAGCVLSYRDGREDWTVSGLGRLYDGGYMCSRNRSGIYCPSVRGHDRTWVQAFTCDGDSNFWTWRGPKSGDGNGVGELPDGGAVICSFVLRYNTDNAWGATRIHGTSPKAIVSDLLFFGEPGAVRNHEDVYNVLFTHGSVESFSDDDGDIARACQGITGANIEKTVDKTIFEQCFDPLHGQE